MKKWLKNQITFIFQEYTNLRTLMRSFQILLHFLIGINSVFGAAKCFLVSICFKKKLINCSYKQPTNISLYLNEARKVPIVPKGF